MLLALYTSCIVISIFFMVGMMIFLLVKKRSQVMLCTECRHCRSACPLISKGCDPAEWMRAAKTDRRNIQAGDDIPTCIDCKQCQIACPRGLAPYLEIHHPL